MKLTTYLALDGNCKDAVYFYEKALEADEAVIQTFGEMPADPHFPMTEEMKKLVLHAEVRFGQEALFLSDSMPGMPYQDTVSDKISIAISGMDEAKANRIFQNLAEGGKVTMPIGPTFWSDAYGRVIDPFGVDWQVSADMN